ncbi:synaptic vesicle membrane protein VAT-1 homolog-like [Zootermopsis nevadensis]|uniref:synaptic vesicle membrane protein VAT-1 homolog-like n=1 Tax=Zootermopsis nevadensis TaxID=136037 RepID=UPI000B8EB965|nr:synaptic vesicle membrane protein VAT-1 homolog-like [Zootermopsis nevadensis]
MSDQQDAKPTEEKAEQPEVSAEENETADKTPEQPPKEMRAVVLTGFGGLKSVKVLKKPEPTLGEGEILIRVKACGLNFQDLMVRQGAIDSPPKTPFTMGFECAGEVEEIGEGVTDFKVGDRVVALPEYRAWAELVIVPSRYVYHIPAELSYLDAAAIAMNYLVAYILLFELGGLAPGKSVLVHSAGGGVGQAVAQLSKTVSDVTVFGVASKNKHEALKASIDHLLERGSDYASEVRKLSPEGVDIVLDCLCGDECNRGYSLLKPMGRYILYGSSNVVTGETKSFFSVARSWWQVDKVSPIKLFDENKTLSGFNLRHLMYQQNGAPYIKRIMESVFSLWKDGKIKPVVDSTWALEDVPEAMQKMHDRKNIGKIVLDPEMEPKPKPATPAKGKAKGGDKEEKKKEEENPGNDTEQAAAETKEEKNSS